jgi:hypothetical protein
MRSCPKSVRKPVMTVMGLSQDCARPFVNYLVLSWDCHENVSGHNRVFREFSDFPQCTAAGHVGGITLAEHCTQSTLIEPLCSRILPNPSQCRTRVQLSTAVIAFKETK